MDQTKEEGFFTHAEINGLVDVTPGDISKKMGNKWDQRDMVRMGKKQELRREFHFFSITGYAMILGCSWEFALMWARSPVKPLSDKCNVLTRSALAMWC